MSKIIQVAPVEMTEQETNERKTSQSKRGRWKHALYEFTQNTTMHGIKKITEPARALKRLVKLLF